MKTSLNTLTRVQIRSFSMTTAHDLLWIIQFSISIPTISSIRYGQYFVWWLWWKLCCSCHKLSMLVWICHVLARKSSGVESSHSQRVACERQIPNPEIFTHLSVCLKIVETFGNEARLPLLYCHVKRKLSSFAFGIWLLRLAREDFQK